MPTRLAPILLLSLIACGKDKGDDSGGTSVAGSSAQVATWNVGLATNFVPYAPERVAPVIEAVAASDADVLCIQEAWREEDIAALTAGVASTYPNAFVSVTTEEGSDVPACEVEETDPLAECAREFCTGTSDLTTCVITYCYDEYDAMSPGCKECAAANIGLNDVDAILGACLTGSSTYAWGGHNGLMLLSKEPMTNTDRTDFTAWLIWRSALHATIGDMNISCTHLSASLTTPVYAGPDASYEAEQATEIENLIAESDTRAAGGVEIILGDMNTGPALTGLSAELPDNYAKFEAAGYADANVAAATPFCTWCTTNTLVPDTDADTTLDHILVKGATTADPVRLFDGTVDVEASEGTVTTNLSDHFGWTSTVSW